MDEALYSLGEMDIEHDARSKKKSRNPKKEAHDSGESVEQEEQGTPPTKQATHQLPDTLVGCSVHIYGKMKNRKELRRYLIAHGADVGVFGEDTTHVIADTARDDELARMLTENDDIKIVNPLWAWDSINTSVCQPEHAYLVS